MKLITPYLIILILFSCSKPRENQKYSFLDNISEKEDVAVGTIEVPENYENPGGNKIQITYAILKSKNEESDKYPVIHLEGGPGGEALSGIERWIDSPIRADRDIIVFDQRGVGFSSDLPDADPGIFKILASNLTIEQEYEMVKDTVNHIKEISARKGISLAQYNTLTNASDVNSLMEKLGYEKYNLYGESYGTRLARFVMEGYPERINSVILNAPAILENDFLTMRLKNFNSVLDELFNYCANDPNCNRQYPDLRRDYMEGIQALVNNPIEATIGDSPFIINPQDALYLLRYQLYGYDAKVSAPAFIKALKVRDIDFINASQRFLVDVVARGNLTMFITTERHEEYNAELTEKEIEDLYAALPNLPVQLAFFSSLHAAVKDLHASTMSKEEKEFTNSEIPTLIYVNKYDPVTPPANGFLFKEKLSNAKLFVLDEAGHGAGSECEVGVIIEFMNAPSGILDSSCLPLFN